MHTVVTSILQYIDSRFGDSSHDTLAPTHCSLVVAPTTTTATVPLTLGYVHSISTTLYVCIDAFVV